jgi:ribosomal protein S18 acetylase RimI-like enzyme
MITELLDLEDLPWDLLLLADPDKKIVENYIYKSRIFVYEDDMDEIQGEIVVLKHRDKNHYEIMNVAVNPNHYRQGIGRQLMLYALHEILSYNDLAEIYVKTGDITDYAIKLYESVGFKIVEVVKDYFIDYYEEPIYEHGERLRNQVIMKYSF